MPVMERRRLTNLATAALFALGATQIGMAPTELRFSSDFNTHTSVPRTADTPIPNRGGIFAEEKREPSTNKKA